MRGRTRALDGLTLRIDRGQHTAILGPNGAGKTTLMRVLTLDDRPRTTAGDDRPALRIFGDPRTDVEDLRRRMGVVTGDLDASFGLSSWGGRVSGLDAATSGLLGTQGLFSHHTVTRDMRVQGRAALERVQAAHLADKPLTEMSTGERRRVLIARALVTRPEVLVLDEPTTGLDFVARHQFLEAVRRLAQEGTTILIVTHHVEEVIPEIGRVVLLSRGRVAFDGPTTEALTSEHLAAVYGAPLVVERQGAYYGVRVAESDTAATRRVAESDTAATRCVADAPATAPAPRTSPAAAPPPRNPIAPS
jgi:iron complex transport system ATP-binding protein